MGKRYVVAVLEVLDVRDGMTFCQAGCSFEDTGARIITPVSAALIVKNIVLTPGTDFTIHEIVANLKMQIK